MGIARLLVFQHIACEHPGILRSFLAEDGIAWDAVELDEGEAIPPLEDYDALLVMGGPMDVWDTEDCPWLIPEKAAIRRWVRERQRPFLGLCLGHQLLAEALADNMEGACVPLRPPEIGILEIELTEAGLADPLFQGLARRQKCLQWHGVQVTGLPEGAQILAKSEACPVQAMRVGPRAWSMQYHVELEADTVANWGRVPAYKTALEQTLGPEALPKMDAAAQAEMPNFLATARRLYENFKGAAG